MTVGREVTDAYNYNKMEKLAAAAGGGDGETAAPGGKI
jgi:hypothetical protein